LPEHGFDRKFTAAITGSAATIGPVIPPSVPFVIYGSITGVSIGQLFLSGFLPGFMMAGALSIAVFFISRRRGYPRQPRSSLREIFASFRAAFWSLMAPVIIIGSILTGVATATEASVVACVYTLILGFAYREFTPADIPRLMWETTLHTIRIMYIIAVAGFFGWLLIHQTIPQQVIAELTNLSSNPHVVMGIIVLILLILGCFMESVATLVITIPVFMPIVAQYHIDPVQFGVIMVLTSMIGLLTPPVGLCLYTMSSISGVPVGKLSIEVLPFVAGILVVTLFCAFVPGPVLWLPNLFR
jgi:C4-dicarboxylate transporter, DctM subunit